MLRYSIALAVGTLVAAPALAAGCEIDRAVIFANLNYGSAQFHTAVAKFIVEKGYDCAVDDIPGDTIPLINGVARGDADIIMEIWTANPAQAWVDAETAGKAVALGTTFPDAVEGWYVPTSVVSGPNAAAPDLKSVADLPKYKDLFADPEEPGKGRFYNCPAGWQCEVVNSKKLVAYGLDEHFTNFRPGTGEALAAAAESAAKRDKPAVFYYWGPTWLLGKYEFTRLQEEPFDQAVWDAMLASDDPSAATAYPVSRVVVGANTAFAAAAPNLTEFFADYASSNSMTSAALAYMRDNDGNADAAALNFLRTQEEAWTPWVSPEAANRVKAALAAS